MIPLTRSKIILWKFVLRVEREWTVQWGRNTTHFYMQLNATIDDVTATANQKYDISGWQSQWRQQLLRQITLRIPSNATSTGCKGQNAPSSSVKNVYCWWIATVMKILYNAVKRLRDGHIFFKWDKMSWSRAFAFKTLLLFLEYIFEFLKNTATPASDSVYRHNFTAFSLPPFCCCFFFCVFLIIFFPSIGWFQFVRTAAIYAFARCCNKRISGIKNNFTDCWKEIIHGNKNVN